MPWRFLNILFATGLAATASDLKLQQQVETIAHEHHGGVTLYAEDLHTGHSVAIAPDRPVATASVIKLTILFEALEQVRSGKAKFEDRITLQKTDQVQGSGVLLFFDTPMALTLKDTLSMMIIMSDNTATNLAIDHLGIHNIDGRIQWLGLKDTYLYKKVFSPLSEPLPPAIAAEQKIYGLGKTTAREMATVMKRIYGCQLGAAGDPPQSGDVKLCATALTMLGDQFYRSGVPRYIDEIIAPGSGSGVAVGNKSGALNQVRNDVAIVAAKRGPIVISAFTFDNKDQSWQEDNEGEITLAKLAKAIINEWSPEGVAPDQFSIRSK